jgi:hypothetical protein
MRKRRKNYTAAEKVASLRRHLIDKVPKGEKGGQRRKGGT